MGKHTSHSSNKWLLSLTLLLSLGVSGCGLIYDVVQRVAPISTDELDSICRRHRVQIGIATEPSPPFVFPAVWTDEGARVTGLDAELLTYITDALSQHCGSRIDPALHLVRFRDLFTLLHEGHLDLFVSSVTANTPSPSRAGFAYSNPYFYNGNIGGIAQRQEVIERVQANLRAQSVNPPPDGLIAIDQALAGLTIAAQKFTSAHHYAETNIHSSQLISCDSLPAAFEYADASTDPAIDVILGPEPVLGFMATRMRNDWHRLMLTTNTPLFLSRDHFAVVMAEDSYRLRWFVNSVLFKLAASGKLDEMRRRWLDESYAFPRRATAEGLSFDLEKLVEHYDQGTCRVEPAH